MNASYRRHCVFETKSFILKVSVYMFAAMHNRIFIMTGVRHGAAAVCKTVSFYGLPGSTPGPVFSVSVG